MFFPQTGCDTLYKKEQYGARKMFGCRFTRYAERFIDGGQSLTESGTLGNSSIASENNSIFSLSLNCKAPASRSSARGETRISRPISNNVYHSGLISASFATSSLFKAAECERYAAQIAVGLAETEYLSGNVETAVQLSREAAQVLRANRNWVTLANVLSNCSAFLIAFHRFDEADARKALSLAREAGVSVRVAASCSECHISRNEPSTRRFRARTGPEIVPMEALKL